MREIFIILSARLAVGSATVHMEAQKHFSQSFLTVAQDLGSVNLDPKFLSFWIVVNGNATIAILE